MPWLTARPRPVPCPSSLVVKNGSKILSRSAAGIPGPLSAIGQHRVRGRRRQIEAPLAPHHLLGGDAQRAAAGHGVDRVHEQVQADLLDLIGIAGDLAAGAGGAAVVDATIPWRWIVSRRNSSASATTGAERAPGSSVGPRWREKSSTWRMILVMRATSSVMMPAFFSTSLREGELDRPLPRRAARPSCASGPRPPADHVQRRADLVGDLGRHLADRGQLLRLAQPRLQPQARRRGPLALLARLAQRAGHGVEPSGQRADLVVALGQDHPRQIALPDGG